MTGKYLSFIVSLALAAFVFMALFFLGSNFAAAESTFCFYTTFCTGSCWSGDNVLCNCPSGWTPQCNYNWGCACNPTEASCGACIPPAVPVCSACGLWNEAGSCGTGGCGATERYRWRDCNLPAGCSGPWVETDCGGAGCSACVPGATVDLGCGGGCAATAMRQTDGCSTWCVPGHPSCSACVPGSWVDQGCGPAGGCATTAMYQWNGCSGQCVPGHPSCSACVPGPWVDQGCGPAGGCAATAMYQTNGCSGQCVAGHSSCIPNNPPTTTVSFQEPDYCAFGPGGTVSWVFSDPDGDPQGSWQVQVMDSGLGTAVYDSGKQAGAANSILVQGQDLNTSYGRNLYVRVMVWDSKDAPSAWIRMSSCARYPGQRNGCVGNTSWNAQDHQYPSSLDFSYTPPLPSPGRPVQFDDSTTTCYGMGNTPVVCNWYNWQFGDGDTLTGNFPAPQHIYNGSGSFTVQMSVRDPDGFICSGAPKTIGVQLPIPEWIEVRP